MMLEKGQKNFDELGEKYSRNIDNNFQKRKFLVLARTQFSVLEITSLVPLASFKKCT